MDRTLPTLVALAVVAVLGTFAAEGAPTRSQCSNNLKQIGLAMHKFDDTGRTGLKARTPYACELCLTEDGSHTLLLTERGTARAESRSLPAKLEGCPPDIGERGFGANPRVSSKPTGRGGIEVRLTSAKVPGCSAVVLLLPTIQQPRDAAARMPKTKISFLPGARPFEAQLRPKVEKWIQGRGGSTQAADWYGCCTSQGCTQVNALTQCENSTFVHCYEDEEGQQSVCDSK